MRLFKACLLFIVLAGSATSALAQTPPPAISVPQPNDDEKKAFYAISDDAMKSGLAIQGELLKVIQASPVDNNKLCDLSKAYTATDTDAVAKQLAFLKTLMSEGKTVESLIPSFLSTSAMADDAVKHEASYCATAKAKQIGADDTQETVIEIQSLIDRLANVRAAYDDANHAGDKLTRLSTTQSEAALLDDIVSLIEQVRDYGNNYSSDAKLLMAQLPQYQQALADAKADKKAMVDPYTDPKGEKDAPYVYTPTVVPPLPDDEEAFEKTVVPLILSTQQPMLHAATAMLSGDLKTGCELSKASEAENVRLRDFIQAFIDKQKAAGKDTATAQTMLAKVNTLLQQSTSTAQTVCSKADNNAAQTNEAEAIETDLLDAKPKYIAAMTALKADAQLHDATKTCADSAAALGQMDRMIKDFDRLIEMIGQPLLMTNQQKAQLDQLKSNVATLKSQRQTIQKLNATSCAAKRR